MEDRIKVTVIGYYREGSPLSQFQDFSGEGGPYFVDHEELSDLIIPIIGGEEGCHVSKLQEITINWKIDAILIVFTNDIHLVVSYPFGIQATGKVML